MVQFDTVGFSQQGPKPNYRPFSNANEGEQRNEERPQ
jgi:hypothetical protein